MASRALVRNVYQRPRYQTEQAAANATIQTAQKRCIAVSTVQIDPPIGKLAGLKEVRFKFDFDGTKLLSQ